MPFSPIQMLDVFSRLEECLAERRGAYACAVCATSIVDASRDPGLMRALSDADINLPDGAPVAWAVSLFTGQTQPRLAGPSVMLKVLEYADVHRHRVVFYGSTERVLEQLQTRVRADYPRAVIADAISPPFRSLSPGEEEALCSRIRVAKPAVVFVGLGEPKQEKWMYAHSGEIPALMIGVGAAFEYNVGLIRRAPGWMQRAGLEWAYRLLQQPRRIGRRLATTLPLFAWRLGVEIIRGRLTRGGWSR